MLRRMATMVAATTTLALAGAAPALADHAPAPEFMAGNPKCADVAEEFDIDGLVSLGKVEDMDDQQTTVDVDPAEFPDHDILVIVKGGDNANVYFDSPFHELSAPENKGGQIPAISHYEICGVPTDGEKPPGEEPPGEEPPGEEPPGEEPPGEEPPDGMGGGDETPKPAVPTEVPAGLSDSGNGGSAAGTVGLLAFITALALGAAALVTRRFLRDN